MQTWDSAFKKEMMERRGRWASTVYSGSKNYISNGEQMQGNMPRLTKMFCLSSVMIFPQRLGDWT